MEQILNYVFCEYCKGEMHEAYVNGDRLSYISHCCNTGNVSAMRCPDASNIFQDRLWRGK